MVTRSSSNYLISFNTDTLDLEKGKIFGRLEMPGEARMYEQNLDGQLCCLCPSIFI